MSSYNPQNGQHPPASSLPFTFSLPPKEPANDQRTQLGRKRSREDDDGEYDIHPEYRDHYDDHANTNASPGAIPLSVGDDEEYGGHSPVEEDFDDDEILKQGLNSDGTPKRPMNAFMIYARRRRPEVSQDYPSLRTGEISKLLSKEWSSMSQDKKKTFLDLAKKLKDRFNIAHPEYVYKRRPNNSRKKRKNSNAQSTTPTLEHQTVTGPVPIVASNGPEVMHPHSHAYGGYDEYHHAHHPHPHQSHPHQHLHVQHHPHAHYRAGGSVSPPQDLGLNGYTLDAPTATTTTGRSSRSSRVASVSSQQHPYDVATDDPSSHLYVGGAGGVQSSPQHQRTTAGNGAYGAYDEGDFGVAYHSHHLQQHHPSNSPVPGGALEGLGLRSVGRHDSVASVGSAGPVTPGAGGNWQTTAPSSGDLLSPLASSDPATVAAVALGMRAGRPHSNSVSSVVGGRPISGARPHSSSISVMGGTGRALGSFTAIAGGPPAPASSGFEHLAATPLHGGSLNLGQGSPEQQGGAAGAAGSWADWGANQSQHFQSAGNGSPGPSTAQREFSTLNSPYYPQGAGDGSSIGGHEDSSSANRVVGNPRAPNNTNGGAGTFHSFQNDAHDVNYNAHPVEQPRFPSDVLGGAGGAGASGGPVSSGSLQDAGNLYSAGTTTTSLPTTASTPPTASAPPTPDYGGHAGQSHEMIATRSMQDVASFMGGASILGASASAVADAVQSQNYGLGAVDHHNPYGAIGGPHHYVPPVLAGAVDSALHHHQHHHHHPGGAYWDSVKAEPAV
ncbi:hypothetical protein FRB90_003100 [Tulasnella sp. 427]|nr:hypothetical protein FRB90_003100 [Tulasnella sp. 427]